MLIYILAVALIGYLGYKGILALPTGKEEPLTDDELEWYYGR